MGRFVLSISARNITRLLGLFLLLASSAPAGAQREMASAQNASTQAWARVSWSAVTEDVDSNPLGYTPSYNVYRGVTSGGPYVLQTATPIPNTFYRDDSVSPGTTYYYVMTAIDTAT